MVAQTALAFEATIGKVQILQAKPDYDGRPAGAKLEFTIVVEQPKHPRKPEMGYGPKERPDEEGANQRAWDVNKQRFEADTVTYQEALAGARDRALTYMSLVASASMLGGQAVSVTMTPANQDLLPGFAAMLLGDGE